MYSVGVFLAFDFLLFILMDIAYRLCPPKIIEKKQEYVLFSLDFLSLYFTLFTVSGIISFSLDLPIQNREEKPASLFLPVFLGCLRFSDKGIYTRSFRVQCYVNRIVVYFVSASISYLCGNDFSVIK